MQPFEFSNNAISLLLSVFSVIVGMTYPLLLQAIQRIDEQYRSSRITKMLKEEKVFRLFQWLVTISIAFAFISIFILFHGLLSTSYVFVFCVVIFVCFS